MPGGFLQNQDMTQERNVVSPQAVLIPTGPETHTKIMAHFKCDTLVCSCAPARSLRRSCIGSTSSHAILDSSQPLWIDLSVSVRFWLGAFTSTQGLEEWGSQILLSPWALLHRNI